MGFPQSLILICTVSLISSFYLETLAQQPYLSHDVSSCGYTDNSTSIFGYFCNGANQTCQSYIIFRSLSPYNTIASIATLFGSDPSQLAQINSVSETATLPQKEVIIPVNCSCSGPYYRANISSVAYGTFQDLSTCEAIQNQNSITAFNSDTGTRISYQTITVPIRCACPTKNQTDVGIKYLLTYPIESVEPVSNISARFGADTMETVAANELSYPYNLFSTTTLLVPLRNPPNSSQLLSPPTPSSCPSQSKASKNILLYVVIAVASFSFNAMRM